MKVERMDLVINCPVLKRVVLLDSIDKSQLRLEIVNDCMVQVIKILAEVQCGCGQSHTVQIL